MGDSACVRQSYGVAYTIADDCIQYFIIVILPGSLRRIVSEENRSHGTHPSHLPNAVFGHKPTTLSPKSGELSVIEERLPYPLSTQSNRRILSETLERPKNTDRGPFRISLNSLTPHQFMLELGRG